MVAALAFAWLALAAVPAIPGPIHPGLDQGWMTGLHLAAANGLVAGRDVVWTYGPLGWLTLPSATEEHFAAMLAYRLALWALWVGGLVVLAFRTRRPAVVTLSIVAVASAAATSAFDYLLPDAQLSLAVLATALLAFSGEGPPRYAPLAMLGALAGLASAIKFNLAAEATAVFIGAAGMAAWEERGVGITGLARTVGVTLVAPLSSVACYTVATGHPEHYPAYLRNALEISSGYSEGMSLPGPNFLVWFALGAAAILLIAIPAASSARSALLRGWFPAAVASFMAFKHGVVRGDIHMLPILLNFSLAAAYLAFTASSASDRRRIASLQWVMTALGLWMVLGVAPGGAAHLTGRLTLTAATETATAILDYPATLRDLVAKNRASRRTMRVNLRLSDLISDRTVEVVPYETSSVWANDWNWRPRPVFQTYQVCTAAHDSLNAAYLAGPRAADVILFHWDPIDERHPLFVDPLSWRETLNHYDAVTLEDRFLAFRRRAEPRFQPPVQISTSPGAWNRPIPVPASQTPLLLAADIPRSPFGHLANLFYRLNPVWLEITSRDHKVTRWRFLRANLPHGVLVSPFPASIDDLAQLAGPEFALQNRARSVRFTGDSPAQFAPGFQIRWLSLPLDN